MLLTLDSLSKTQKNPEGTLDGSELCFSITLEPHNSYGHQIRPTRNFLLMANSSKMLGVLSNK